MAQNTISVHVAVDLLGWADKNLLLKRGLLPMSLHWTGLIHEKLAVIVSFAYSQKPLANMRHRFHGEWKFLEKIVNDIPRRAAAQAVVDFALYFRTLDDEQRVTDYWRQAETPPTFGMLYMREGNNERLLAREMSNKIIHAERIEWDLSGEPRIICIGRENEAGCELKLI